MAKFLPVAGAYLTVSLPGELLRAQIIKVVTADAVIVELVSEPLARLQHNYKQNNIVACRRTKTMFGEDWVAVDKQTIALETLVEQEENAVVKPSKKEVTPKPQKKTKKIVVKLKKKAKKNGKK